MMKIKIALLIGMTILAGCSLNSKNRVHPEHGAVSATDDLYLTDHDKCLAEFLSKEENVAKEAAQESTSQVASVLAMDDLAALIQLSGGLAASDEAQNYVHGCMKNAGWQQLNE